MRAMRRFWLAAGCAAVIAVLVVLAIPAMQAMVVHPQNASADIDDSPLTTPTATSSPEIPTDSAPSESQRPRVNVGYGTSIPADGVDGCDAPAYIHLVKTTEGEWRAQLAGAALVDRGTRALASGEVGYSEGRIATYTVAAGDAPGAIGERFCIYNGAQALAAMNGHGPEEPLQPEEVIVLDPDAVPGWVFQPVFR